MREQQLETLRAEKLPEALNTRRALGRGLGALLLHRLPVSGAKAVRIHALLFSPSHTKASVKQVVSRIRTSRSPSTRRR